MHNIYIIISHIDMNEWIYPINVPIDFEMRYISDHNDYNVIPINFIVLRDL